MTSLGAKKKQPVNVDQKSLPSASLQRLTHPVSRRKGRYVSMENGENHQGNSWGIEARIGDQKPLRMGHLIGELYTYGYTILYDII